jgi:hypothetical protein
MVRIVPALTGQIDPANEGQVAVDADHLLVMRPAEGVTVVVVDVDPFVVPPAGAEEIGKLGAIPVKNRAAPNEQIDMQPGLRFDELAQCVAQCRAAICGRGIRDPMSGRNLRPWYPG